MQALIEQALHKATKHSRLVQTLTRWRPVLGCLLTEKKFFLVHLHQCSASRQCMKTEHCCCKRSSFCCMLDTVLTCFE